MHSADAALTVGTTTTSSEGGEADPNADTDLGPPDAFRFWTPAAVLDRHYSGGHLTACAADELMFHARSAYFADGVRWPGIDNGLWLVYRHIAIDYLDEAFVGEALRCGVRSVGRSRRTVRMQQVLQVTGAHARTVATAALVVVAFDTEARRSVELPAELWAAIESYERGDDD